MPGIIGFHESNPSSTSAKLLENMAAALQVRPSDVVSVYANEQIHLGSIRLGVMSQAAQPAWNADHSIGVVMAGEIFAYGEQAKALQAHSYTIADGDAAQFVASLYQEEGESFVRSLNGAFAIAIWDARQRKLVLANDRLGFEPLYYTQSAGRFAFASGVRSLLADSSLPRAVNMLAMAQFLTFDHVLGNHTFLQDIQLLPPGSILTLIDGRVAVQAYWQLEFPETYARRSEREYQEEMIFLLRQATTRQRTDQPAGILLSGGLDSRFIFALLQETHPPFPLRAFTMGNPGCDDLRYAKELADHLNTPHEFFPLHPNYLIERAEQGIQLTDGMENVVHMHTLDNLAAQAERAPIIYKGFLGDALAGYFSYRDLLGHYDADDLIQIFFERYPIVFNPAAHDRLFAPAIQGQLQDMVLQTARQEFMPTGSCALAADLFFQFDVHHRQRRLTLNGVQLVRSQALVRTPFYDNDVVDFMLRVPQGYRLERHLIKQTFIRAFPELAKIPYTETGYPMMPCRRELFMRMNEHIRWRLRAAGLKGVPVPQKRHYASYNAWFRGELRGWAEAILLGERSLARGIFNPQFVRQLIDEHMAGQGHYQKLGTLISIELWHRKFID